MKLFRRVSKLLEANVNHMLDSAEDPEVMVKQLIHDMEASLAELRGETVRALARQKQLERAVTAAGGRADELEKKAALALDHGNEALARKVLAQRVDAMKDGERVAGELKAATALARRVKHDLVRLQKQADLAREKRDGLIRRKRAAEASLKAQEAARRSSEAIRGAGPHDSGSRLDGYAAQIDEIEARAEADRELSDDDDRGDAELKLAEMTRSSDVDAELERLKAARAASA